MLEGVRTAVNASTAAPAVDDDAPTTAAVAISAATAGMMARLGTKAAGLPVATLQPDAVRVWSVW